MSFSTNDNDNDTKESAGFKPFTKAERIQQLNDIDKSITQLLHSAGRALQTLASSESASQFNPSDRREAFEEASNLYLKTLRTVDVGLKRQILGLEEADIIKAASAKPKLKDAKDLFIKSGPKTAEAADATVTEISLGKLDVGWLNSRSGRVGRDMEAELWGKARAFLEGLENIEAIGENQHDEDDPMGREINSKLAVLFLLELLHQLHHSHSKVLASTTKPLSQPIRQRAPASTASHSTSILSPRFAVMDLEVGGDSPWGDVPSQSSPPTTKATDNLFEDAAESSSKPKAPQSLEPPSSQTLKSPAGRQPRTPRRAVAHQVRLEALDDSLGPLGPLGENAPPPQVDQPPAPPQKEQVVTHNVRQPAASSQGAIGRQMLDPSDDDAEPSAFGPRIPPPVQPSPGTQVKRDTQPSVSVEQAAKPTFEITVGDPHKVGDLTSSHIVYLVRTKTTSKAYRQSEFAVTRRYRDFLWLYNSLHGNNPGIIVPPPPEKQAVGRFDQNFVESRRAALERMLNKTAQHPTLQHDGDLKLFLESEAFNVDVKHKERKEPGLGESKGMFSGLGISVGSGGSKFVEQDDWFHERRVYLDALENQLKSLLKAMDTVVTQRKGLAEAAGDFSNSLHALSSVELSPSLSHPLEGLSDLQLRIKELYDRQAQQDVLTLGITIDEYIRLIGSIKQAFQSRQKAYHSWHSAESEMQKRKSTQEKLLRQGKTQQDRLTQMQADVTDAERKVHQARLLFEDMGRLMRSELERFEREKVEDFKSAVETFLESAVEAQKELIELWETFLMQLDAEEDENAFYRPPVEPTTRPSGERRMSGETAVDSHAAAIATAEEDSE
ncbi:hypothetical protein G7Y89_g14830 [Cudoniella acicularis]|uniref:Mediator of RNA polymerase II transcription subunit 11 n=1 Tax=Cudoniella acicularis TaxID=354080 RepID=A0A8H4VR51_9HELO|nr:hypothetical protein G7Y89_g14830 [Cudoniella acicularis]